jgi:hypothetical protein
MRRTRYSLGPPEEEEGPHNSLGKGVSRPPYRSSEEDKYEIECKRSFKPILTGPFERLRF